METEMIAKFLQALALEILFYHARGGPSSRNVFPGEQIETMRVTVASRWHKRDGIDDGMLIDVVYIDVFCVAGCSWKEKDFMRSFVKLSKSEFLVGSPPAVHHCNLLIQCQSRMLRRCW